MEAPVIQVVRPFSVKLDTQVCPVILVKSEISNEGFASQPRIMFGCECSGKLRWVKPEECASIVDIR